MTAGQAVILVAGSLALLTAMIAMMIRANKREHRVMERRRQEWIARGSIPEKEPNSTQAPPAAAAVPTDSWRWRRDLNPRRATGQGAESTVTCEITFRVIR